MKPIYTPLNKLNDHSKDFKIKVKVIHKGEPRQTPPKRRYQKLVFKDDEGNTMDGTIFEDDIEVLDEAIVKNGEYELSNVVIKTTPEPFKSRSGDYQMSINGSIRIKPLDLSGCSTEPQYRYLSKIPREQNNTDELIDLVGVVLYVSELRTIKREDVEEKIRDIIIADQSENRPFKITAWNDAAQQQPAFFQLWAEAFKVVGFTNIRPITNRGISLVSRSSKAFVEQPTGDLADEVCAWANQNKNLLEDWRGKAMLIHNDASKKTPLPVHVVLQKKASTIWQDEKFWIQVMMASLEEKDIYCYIGCSKCGRTCTENLGAKFVCTRCHNKNAVAETRALMNITVSDKSGNLRITAFTKEVELMIGMNVDAIASLKKSNNKDAITSKIVELRKKEMLLQIAPTGTLFINNVLKWIVRAVEVPIEEE